MIVSRSSVMVVIVLAHCITSPGLWNETSHETENAPHMKPNNVPLYIDRNSNHPPAIIKQLPKSINVRISSLSTNHSLFESTAPVYKDALKRSQYN